MTDPGIKIVGNPYNAMPTKSFQVEDTTTSSANTIYAGTMVKIVAAGGTTSTAGGQFVAPLATGEPEVGVDIVAGLAAGDADNSSSLDGNVDVYLPLPGYIYRCAAATGSNLADSLMNDTVTFDYSSDVFTVDENEGTDDNVHGLIMLDYDADEDTVDFMLKIGATFLGSAL